MLEPARLRPGGDPMMGIIVGYAAARSASRAQARRRARPAGYAEFEFMVIVIALLIGIAWPIHLGMVMQRRGLPAAWAISIAALLGIIGLATGPGYVIIAVVYSGVWLAVLIDRGVRAEEQARGEALGQELEG